MEEVEKFELLLQQAEAGDLAAMHRVGIAYIEGRGTDPDPNQFFIWMLKAAEAGSPIAMYNVALAYENGEGTNQSVQEYFIWLKKAAEAGYVPAMVSLSLAYSSGVGTDVDESQFFIWTKKAAEAGDVDGMFNLGLAYLSGEGTTSNTSEFFNWMHKAANLGSVSAMFNIAEVYLEGEITKQDKELFFKWISKAAKGGDVAAMFNLSIAFSRGDGTTKNLKKSGFWLKRAAEAGLPRAMFRLATSYISGTLFRKNNKKFFEWMKKSAEAGEVDGIFILALAYLEGRGTKSDIEQYLHWIGKAVEAGHADASMLHYINNVLKLNEIQSIEILRIFFDLFRIVDKIKSEHVFPDDKDMEIAHFTPFNTIEKMLPLDGNSQALPVNNHLRLYNVEYLNDPYEGRRLFQRMKQLSNFEKIYSLIFANLDKDSAIDLLEENLSIYICAFTLSSDRLDLWRAYGNDGEGVCIVSPINAFEDGENFHALGDHLKQIGNINESIKSIKETTQSDEGVSYLPQTAPKVLYQVRYQDNVVDETLNKLYPSLMKLTYKIIGADIEKQKALRKCVIAVMSDILFLYKNPEYENEKEARLVFAACIGNQMLELDEQTPGRLFVKTDNFLFKETGSRIIIGPKEKKKKEVELNFKFRLNKHGFDRTIVEHSLVAYR